MTCVPSKDSDHPGHPPSLIRVCAVCIQISWVLSYPLSTQRGLWSEWMNAQADLSLCWAYLSFCWFCHAVAHFICNEFKNCDSFLHFFNFKIHSFIFWCLVRQLFKLTERWQCKQIAKWCFCFKLNQTRHKFELICFDFMKVKLNKNFFEFR